MDGWQELEATLRPCPFCGGSPRIEKTMFSSFGEKEITIVCAICGARVEHTQQAALDGFYTNRLGKLNAMQLWNGEALEKEAER